MRMLKTNSGAFVVKTANFIFCIVAINTFVVVGFKSLRREWSTSVNCCAAWGDFGAGIDAVQCCFACAQLL